MKPSARDCLTGVTEERQPDKSGLRDATRCLLELEVPPTPRRQAPAGVESSWQTKGGGETFIAAL